MINTFSNFRESLAPFNELDLAYLAGMIDADGFITIQRTTKANTGKCEHPSVYHALKVGIGGTERQPHDLASSIFGGTVSRYTPKNEAHKPNFQWCSSGPTAVIVIRAIYPYLRIKGRQVQVGLSFQESLERHIRLQRSAQKPPYRITNEMREERDSFWRQMLALNNPRNLRIGKKAAGRLLDCRTWDEMPEAVHA